MCSFSIFQTTRISHKLFVHIVNKILYKNERNCLFLIVSLRDLFFWYLLSVPYPNTWLRLVGRWLFPGHEHRHLWHLSAISCWVLLIFFFFKSPFLWGHLVCFNRIFFFTHSIYYGCICFALWCERRNYFKSCYAFKVVLI